jgi:hypothetical protein
MLIEVGCWFQPSTVFVQISTIIPFREDSSFPQVKRFPITKRAYAWPRTDAWELLKQDLGDNEVHILSSSSDIVVQTLNYITSFVNEWSTERTKEEPQRSCFSSFYIGSSSSKPTNFLTTESNGKMDQIKKMLV